MLFRVRPNTFTFDFLSSPVFASWQLEEINQSYSQLSVMFVKTKFHVDR